MSGSPGGPGREVVAEMMRAAADAHQRFVAYGLDGVVAAAGAVAGSLRRGGRLLVFGNGGSAADAQHLAAELVGRFSRDRGGLAAVALASDASVLTSVANDFGYGAVFARQVEALGRPGDVALGISTSGESESVVRALAVARAGGLITVALTGRDGGAVAGLPDIHINVRERSVPRIQEVHRTVLHAICEIVERDLCPGPAASSTP